MNGPFSVSKCQFPDKTYNLKVRLGDDKIECRDLSFDWMFKVISDTYHFGENEGIKKVYKEINDEFISNSNRTIKDKILGIWCYFWGHKLIDSYCIRCMSSLKFKL